MIIRNFVVCPSEFSWYITLRLTDRCIHIHRPRTVISASITSVFPERVNYRDILLCCWWRIFSILYLVPQSWSALISFHMHREEITQPFIYIIGKFSSCF
jgi:hypothetical protein